MTHPSIAACAAARSANGTASSNHLTAGGARIKAEEVGHGAAAGGQEGSSQVT
ncbi:MAG TPA: hypothetical protein VMU94_16160 [Streptosporangiaceae bacterium]|nr:hypothetical protein [Streptosporangiaceae bacterium]